jgi:hypothetical protein
MTGKIDAQWREEQLNKIVDFRRQLERAHSENWFYVDPSRYGVVIGFDTARYLALVRWPDRRTEWRAIGSIEPVAPKSSPVA